MPKIKTFPQRLLAGLLTPLAGVLLCGATFLDRDIAVLHGLDKIAAEVKEIQAPVGQEVRFGRLRINVLACRVRPPEETPESAAFLEIIDIGRNLQPVETFRGWMFASSPSLSAMEHTLYDIWVARCLSTAELAAFNRKDHEPEDMGHEPGPTAGRLFVPPVPYKKTSQR